MSLNIDVAAFNKRVAVIQNLLKDSSLKNSQALVTVLGKGDEETQKQLACSLHLWLLGVPFANTCIIIGKEKVYLIAAAKQTKHLEPIRSQKTEILTRGKEPSECSALLGEVLQNKLGLNEDDNIAVFSEDKPESPIASAFRSTFEGLKGEKIDASAAFIEKLEVKDESELRAVRMASKAASGLIAQVFVDKMSTILDEGKQVANSELGKTVADSIDNLKLLTRLKIGSEFNASELDWAEQPLVNENKPGNVGASGIIRIALTPSYRNYTAYCVRTYMVNSSAAQKANYQLLFSAQRKAIQAAVSGATAQDIWNAVYTFVESKNPDLLPYLVSPVGCGVGLQVFDNTLAFKDGNVHKLVDDQTATISIEFRDLPGEKEPYTLKIADTLRIVGDQPVVFTDAPKSSSEIAFELEDGDSEDEIKREKADIDIPDVKAARRPRAARQMEKREMAENAERIIEEHQAELKKRLQEYGAQKYANTEDADIQDNGPVFRKFEAYKREAQLPKVGSLRISLDQRAHAIIVPINGRPVPFHINTFRSGNASEEGQYVYLRLNFNSPDSTMAKRDDVPYDNPEAHFLKSVTLRSRDGERMRETLKKIQDLKKESTRRENERRQLADVVEQEKLIESRDRRAPRLEQVFVRPMPEGKRIPGSLEIHRNGVRYTSPIREQTVEVLFSNVEHIFYQPNDHEIITLIHFHLKNPIMVGKRKTKDVQFYRDATDMTADDTGHRKRRYRYGDEDELEQEQEERRLRVRLNREFYNFSEEIAKASHGQLEVDTPFRELGFNGVPFRANMFMQPTTNCLVQLAETPFFVVTLSEVELAVLERVRFGLKQFDIVFIYKDYKRPVTQINSVPMTQLDSVKSWLNEVDIPFYEAELNFNWKEVMNTINSSPHQFFVEDGGWSFLDPEAVGSDAGEVDDDDDEPGEEEFTASELEEVEESEISDEVSGSDFDEDEESDASELEPEEEGEDWSDLEEEAKREDRRKEKKEDL